MKLQNQIVESPMDKEQFVSFCQADPYHQTSFYSSSTQAHISQLLVIKSERMKPGDVFILQLRQEVSSGLPIVSLIISARLIIAARPSPRKLDPCINARVLGSSSASR